MQITIVEEVQTAVQHEINMIVMEIETETGETAVEIVIGGGHAVEIGTVEGEGM